MALGSDFDGAVSTPFDSERISSLTAGLIKAGFSDDEIAKIMGKNALNLFKKVLPS